MHRENPHAAKAKSILLNRQTMAVAARYVRFSKGSVKSLGCATVSSRNVVFVAARHEYSHPGEQQFSERVNIVHYLQERALDVGKQ